MTRPSSAVLLVALALVSPACTPRAASIQDHAQAKVTAPAAEPTAEPQPEPPPAPTPEPELLSPDTPPVSGFVIYTQEQTIIVPIDGSPRVIGEGLWLQDDRASPPALSHTLIMSGARAQTMGLPRCPCLAGDGACIDDSVESRSFDPRTGALVREPAQPCTCTRLHEPLAYPPTELDGEQFEACATDEDQVLASLVAGQLHHQGWEWNGACFHGLSIYDALAWRHDLIDEAPELISDGMRSLGCNNDMGPAYAERPWPIDRGALTRECEDYFESEVFMLRRGDLWAVRDDISGVHGYRRYLKQPARPDRCPTVNDPCGDPEPFRKPAKLDRKQREFWIATDGRAALTAERHAYALWLADADASLEFELAGIDASTDVIGVRTHADIGPLRALIGKHPTLGVDRPERASTILEPDACLAKLEPVEPGADPRELGNTCFMYIGLGSWSRAEAACLQGLAVATELGTRGAILYNLGLIAEAEGAREQAGLYFRESLAVRPGNRTVERALAKLKLP